MARMFLTKASVQFVAAFCIVSISALNSNDVESWVEVGDECPWTGPSCIEGCLGRQDGFYQSCRGCFIYARCQAKKVYLVNCPSGTIWDDNLKRCDQKSTTCYCYQEPENCTTTGPRCIRSCSGISDGDYQSCHGCSVYATCSNGNLYDYRPCNRVTPPFQWDDNERKCLPSSTTCKCTRNSDTMSNRLRWSRILKK